ncbi:Aromatic compound dioxygenase [Rhizoctonia solani]|uniref:Aromatic compound dioxygenase n=1 Tax=Rhizoctonia solani TaxID=456999 RepID=A0A8H7HH25_9AGAM|nr:Aromatic compound dioxygenase [Rhizoctonia solani]
MMVGFLNVFAAASIASSAVLGGFTSSRAVLEVIDLLSAHAPINPSHTALLKRRAENLSLQRRISEKCDPQLSRRRAARLSRRAARAGLTLDELHERTSLISRQATDNSTEGTCILTPEVTQGPYHILGEMVRQNISEGQAGVPLTVEVDFIDVETCEANLWVDAWHCNSTGYYSGYVSMTGAALSGGGGFGGAGGNNTNRTAPPDMSVPNLLPTTTTAELATSTQDAYSGADSTAAASMLNNVPTDQESFLRGTWQADSDGHWTMHSIFPGWYSGRSIHFHNGTFIAGRAMHTGQIFFNESIVQEIAQLAPYNTNNVSRLTNDDDQWFAYENAEGYDAVMDVVYAGQDVSEGLIGSIIVGLNTSYTSVELSTQWWAGEDSKSASAVTTTDSTLTTIAVTVSSTSTDISVGVTAGDKDCDSE